MKALTFLLFSTLVFAACGKAEPAKNPDPNHTHADFAVWIQGERIDFSKPDFMSGTTDESDPDHTKHHPYLHLHDGIGHVIHRHKPGLTIGEFLASIGVKVTKRGLNICLSIPGQDIACEDEAMHRNWVFMVDGERKQFLDLSFVFADVDNILIALPVSDTDEGVAQEVEHYLSQMTDDACLYSKTCPERGDPPAENCVADPEIPCQ